MCERSWVRVPVGPCAFSFPVTFGGSVWVRARAASSKGTVSSVPAWFRADSGTNLIKQGEIVTGRSCGSVAQWSECSHGMREVLGLSPGRAMCFFLPCDIWWPRWVRARAASSKGTVLSVPAWFRADSGTNLIKQGEIVTGRPCGSVFQWSECSHGVREVLGSSPGRAMCFFLPCDITEPRHEVNVHPAQSDQSLNCVLSG